MTFLQHFCRFNHFPCFDKMMDVSFKFYVKLHFLPTPPATPLLVAEILNLKTVGCNLLNVFFEKFSTLFHSCRPIFRLRYVRPCLRILQLHHYAQMFNCYMAKCFVKKKLNSIFIILGIRSNLKIEPILFRWFVVCFEIICIGTISYKCILKQTNRILKKNP